MSQNELVRKQKHVIISIIQVPHVKARCLEYIKGGSFLDFGSTLQRLTGIQRNGMSKGYKQGWNVAPCQLHRQVVQEW
ncbi:hypothetical protein SCLCIDRAFT_242657 [Scleroderma citrinum Foug A]|uniref:Uncharacterized protein n=1 Tax=Scleroderma citrinum Foug A TaxID=1036808 RepID=A0A0C3DJS8_9AGAM|nr:hypothetical protein SCLCIDRAFT_242657 [Scleroderma citrinum Foug A]